MNSEKGRFEGEQNKGGRLLIRGGDYSYCPLGAGAFTVQSCWRCRPPFSGMSLCVDMIVMYTNSYVLYLYICIYTYTHTRIHRDDTTTYIYIYIYIYTYTYTHIHVYIYIYIHIRIYTYIYGRPSAVCDCALI